MWSKRSVNIQVFWALLCLVPTCGASLAQNQLGKFAVLANDSDCKAENIASTTAIIGKTLKAGDTNARSAGIQSLIQVGASAVPALMVEMASTLRPDSNAENWPPEIQSYAIALTSVTRSILGNDPAAIRSFRDCDTGGIIRPLVFAARSDLSPLRINSASILANIIDNTTVCFVLDQLRDKIISVNGRANLLGVTNSMASYAYKENVASIEKTLLLIEEGMSGGSDLSQTIGLISSIRSRLASSANRLHPIPEPLRQYCANYVFQQN
jgi:hypothetical protein